MTHRSSAKKLALTAAILFLVIITAVASRALAKTSDPHIFTLSGDFEGTHDPSIIKAGDTWYVFASGRAPDGSHMAIRCSKDLQNWKHCGHVFAELPDWIQKDSPGTKELWAPDISYFNATFFSTGARSSTMFCFPRNSRT